MNIKINTVISIQKDLPRVLGVIEWAKDNNIPIRLLPELANIRESTIAALHLCRLIEAKEINRYYTLGSSSYISSYCMPDGYVFNIKHIREFYLEKTMCLNCSIKRAGKCTEKFYGIRLEKCKNGSNKPKLFIRLCLHRTDSSTYLNINDFFASSQFREIQEKNLAYS
jgi:hypothetical protein